MSQETTLETAIDQLRELDDLRSEAQSKMDEG